MPAELILANAALVLPDRIALGNLCLREGRIVAVGSGSAVPRGAIDCDGDVLAPGLVELHTDNLERHLTPRPKVDWPHRAAILAHDGELASTGITTVFDAIRVGSIPSVPSVEYDRYARPLADEILALRDAGHLRISHHLHLRAEICSETLVDELDEFDAGDRIGIVSLMDHTPGQRQYRDVTKLEDYLTIRHGLQGEALAAYLDRLRGLQARLGARHAAAAVAAAGRFGAALASHDDATAGQVAASMAQGVRMAEFPTTRDAAEACRAAGIAVIMGAPNLIRGGSHSGNVATQDLAEAGLLDILSSDYVPVSLLMGAVRLGEIWGDMARGLATVTSNPAAAVGMADRGRLEPGLRADLIRFRMDGGTPVLRGVWARGRQVG